jgi:hypothetical protein
MKSNDVADRPDAWQQDTISSMDLQDMLEQVRAEIAPSVGEGAVADYIPGLASVDPQQFGMAVASNDGEVHVVGDCRCLVLGPEHFQSLQPRACGGERRRSDLATSVARALGQPVQLAAAA